MKVIEKITLIIYSNLMLILSVIACLIIFKWLDIGAMQNLTESLLFGDTSSKIILGVSIVFILLSIRCIFFDPTSKQEQKDREGILLANENGRLMISRETIVDLVEGVIKQTKLVKDASNRVEFDKENNINIYVNLTVSSDAIIKDLSTDLQDQIKSKAKEATDLDVKEVNIVVRKIVPEETSKKCLKQVFSYNKKLKINYKK